MNRCIFRVECPLEAHFILLSKDNVDRTANHRQADLIGPSFQQSTNRNSPSHQDKQGTRNRETQYNKHTQHKQLERLRKAGRDRLEGGRITAGSVSGGGLRDDDVDLEALVNDMNSSFESLYSSCTVPADSAPLLHNGQPQRLTYQTHAQPISPHQRLRRSQPMHILAVRRLQEEEQQYRTSSLPAIPNPFPELCSPAGSPTLSTGSLPQCQPTGKYMFSIVRAYEYRCLSACTPDPMQKAREPERLRKPEGLSVARHGFPELELILITNAGLTSVLPFHVSAS
ncbi:Growth factor receptor-bound protein 10 GRB10 adapter protein [Triplophysa tibetana]|uniref:Growth factor receptor-bound protein 10 GRB10 adapter protein n=1 Tax=Triplophysa tibetana TaxID=1572043 RepID=A0A5A9N1X6_9TELE|nr:Growth factor receptor-bound protein 10 GRB10 adapter protein [Triplophysa tibetana]